MNNYFDRIYRTEFPRIFAVLTRLFGAENIELAEDTVHDAFDKALHHWRQNGLPENPEAWLMKTAKNRAIDVIRANRNKLKLSADLSQYLESEWSLSNTVDIEFSEDKITDDQLRMMFMCCRRDISAANQIPLLLQLVCGFSIAAIARALLISEDTVKKRLFRTKQQLKTQKLIMPSDDQLPDALNTVHTVIYLLFNEGFHCSSNKQAIDRVLCHEAVGLVTFLTDVTGLANADTFALLALIQFHFARVEARLDENGCAIPIDLQDRSLWDTSMIETAEKNLARAHEHRSELDFGHFFFEALISREHCRAASFERTRWSHIVQYYHSLIALTQSPVARLNQAVAIAYAGEISTAIKSVISLQSQKIFKGSHLPTATLAHLYAKAGNKSQAYAYAEKSKKLGGTVAEQALMMKQIDRCFLEPVQVS